MNNTNTLAATTTTATAQAPTSSRLLQEDGLTFASSPPPLSNTNNPNSYTTRRGQTSTSQRCPMVEVVAPATLRGGYTFDVEVNREVFSVTVPPQGVKEGDTICVQTEPKIQEASTLFRIPLGSWKDGLCEFCKYGPCHPSFLVSCLFPLISLGHIYTRLELQWFGSPHDMPTRNTQAFKTMVWLTFAFLLMKQVMVSFQSGYKFLYFLNVLYGVIVAILVGRTRRFMREKYDIPATFTQIIQNNGRIADCLGVDRDYGDDEDAVLPVCCGEVEDYCLGGLCYPCVLSQMSRHTAMYDTYEGSFFNSSGLPEHAPVMI